MIYAQHVRICQEAAGEADATDAMQRGCIAQVSAPGGQSGGLTEADMGRRRRIPDGVRRRRDRRHEFTSWRLLFPFQINFLFFQALGFVTRRRLRGLRLGAHVMETTPHYFGGLWTELKLEAISAYSKFFTGALKTQNFDLWYIDPFAGTGSREEIRVTGGLLTGEPAEATEVSYPGSAARSLMVQPPFHHFVFGDERRSRRAALAKLKAQYPERDIRIVPGDANDALQDLFGQSPLMCGSMARGSARAFVFLDPYGMSVRWATLAKLAASQRADVWFLVNLKAAIQQLCRDHGALDEHKRAASWNGRCRGMCGPMILQFIS